MEAYPTPTTDHMAVEPNTVTESAAERQGPAPEVLLVELKESRLSVIHPQTIFQKSRTTFGLCQEALQGRRRAGADRDDSGHPAGFAVRFLDCGAWSGTI